MNGELYVRAMARCGGWRSKVRLPFQGEGEVKLRTDLAGITYEIEVDVRHLEEIAAGCGNFAHSIIFSGRRYISEEGTELPAPVAVAFSAALRLIAAWMASCGWTYKDVFKLGIEQAERRARIEKEQRRFALKLRARAVKRNRQDAPIEPAELDALGLERIEGETIRQALGRFELRLAAHFGVQ